MPDSSEARIENDAIEISPADYMRTRVVNQIEYYEKAANCNKKAHVWAQVLAIVLGVLVPVVLNLPAEVAPEPSTKIVATGLSLLLAILSS